MIELEIAYEIHNKAGALTGRGASAAAAARDAWEGCVEPWQEAMGHFAVGEITVDGKPLRHVAALSEAIAAVALDGDQAFDADGAVRDPAAAAAAVRVLRRARAERADYQRLADEALAEVRRLQRAYVQSGVWR